MKMLFKNQHLFSMRTTVEKNFFISIKQKEKSNISSDTN